MSETGAQTRETAQCTKCTREIPVDADRCPECGYEPGTGILGGIVMWVSLMLGSTFLVIALASIIVTADGFPVLQGLTVAGFTGFIAAIFLGIVYAGYKGGQRGPTDESFGSSRGLGGESKSMTESWQDGAERGEEWADRINEVYYAAVQALPTHLWTAGVLLGCVLSFAMWPAAAAENETAMSISLIAGGGLLFLVVLIDTLRVNHQNDDLEFRWWFWSILSFVPLIGWLFGLGWLWRRRKKTASAA